MSIESRTDLEGLTAAGRAAAAVLGVMARALEHGVTPVALDRLGAREMRRLGARSAPMLDAGFPASTCISVAPTVAHGIPDERPLEEGQLVNLDVSVKLGGYYADTGASYVVGRTAAEPLRRLARSGREALERALGEVRAGAPLNRIGWAAERAARRAGYRVIRDLCGHGVGRALHEEPFEIAAHWNPWDSRRLTEGQVLAIEPFLSAGADRVEVAADGWALRTPDGSPAVQHEHTVVVTRHGALVVTAEKPWLVRPAA